MYQWTCKQLLKGPNLRSKETGSKEYMEHYKVEQSLYYGIIVTVDGQEIT